MTIILSISTYIIAIDVNVCEKARGSVSTDQVNKKKKNWRSLHKPITGKKKKLAEFTLLYFYLNRYSSGVYNRP
jgi:hypothetical protein